MKVADIGIRRRGLAALRFSPPLPEKIENADYEGEKILVDRVILSRCNIKVGTVLEEDDIKQLVFVSECYRAKQRAIWYLSRGDNSEKGLYKKLCRNFSEKAADFAVKQMADKGYINDITYAERLIKKYDDKNVSARQARAKLFEKSVPANIVEEVLSGYFEGDGERAYNLICEKYSKKVQDAEERKKVFSALLRKGFSFSDIKHAMDKMVKAEYDFDEEI